MKVFSTKVVSLHRASFTEPKKHKNQLGEPLLKKLHDETPKKVSPDLMFVFAYFQILPVINIIITVGALQQKEANQILNFFVPVLI